MSTFPRFVDNVAITSRMFSHIGKRKMTTVLPDVKELLCGFDLLM
ncbi:hypothetical protein [Mechercharimyces sp. CAU 1602]|nr:hypothetical protein [Mechercharimyces sp. CAU 1602]MCS1350062.1 hypothetical protein [Mechercharimyces sp. CAU 1602]